MKAFCVLCDEEKEKVVRAFECATVVGREEDGAVPLCDAHLRSNFIALQVQRAADAQYAQQLGYATQN